MALVRLIGDIHGRFSAYKNLLKGCERSIQVGDYGIGFAHTDSAGWTTYSKGPFDGEPEPGFHRFIRGNHDNPDACKASKQWIPDGTMHEGFWCMGGALSIDKGYRTEGRDYWDGEELSVTELNQMINIYEDIKPEFVITHDCPEAVARHLFPFMSKTTQFHSRTREALQAMFEIHQPTFWAFGHWHMPKKETILGTEFVCLDIGQCYDIDTETHTIRNRNNGEA